MKHTTYFSGIGNKKYVDKSSKKLSIIPSHKPMLGLTTKCSFRTLAPYRAQPSKQMLKHISTRSIGQRDRNSEINQKSNFLFDIVNDEEELFHNDSTVKYKLAADKNLKLEHLTQQVSEELAHALEIIKRQKMKIGEKMTELKKLNQKYKQFDRKKFQIRQQKYTNTDFYCFNADIRAKINRQTSIESFQTNAGISSFQPQQKKQDQEEELYNTFRTLFSQSDKFVTSQEQKTYVKLINLLQDLGINPQQILPDEPLSQIYRYSQKQYKILTSREVIKLQKFILKKLVSLGNK